MHKTDPEHQVELAATLQTAPATPASGAQCRAWPWCSGLAARGWTGAGPGWTGSTW